MDANRFDSNFVKNDSPNSLRMTAGCTTEAFKDRAITTEMERLAHQPWLKSDTASHLQCGSPNEAVECPITSVAI